jgi:GT2 family glycosyltransferase
MRKSVAIIMPVLECLDYTKQTYESFYTDKHDYHWIIVDNSPSDATEKWIRSLTEGEQSKIEHLPQEENIGVARSWNLGITKALELGFDLAFVINNDLVFAPDTFDNLLNWYGQEDQGKYEFVTVVNAGADPELLDTQERKPVVSKSPNFIGFLINSRTVKRIGLFDEGFKLAYFEDNDYHQRLIEESIAAVCCHDALVVHYGSRTIKNNEINHDPAYVANRWRFKEKWGFYPELTEGSDGPYIKKANRAKLLWIGDAVAPTGFAKVTHNVINYLKEQWEVHVLGINYRGDPHDYSYPIYPASFGGKLDPHGADRVEELIDRIKPDIICGINDHFVVPKYLGLNLHDIPIVMYMPVDAKNVAFADRLNKLDAAIFYTKFGLDEARIGGYTGQAYVVPHGVNLRHYKPMDTQAARDRLGIGNSIPKGAFLFGNVNRNQPRKHQDWSLFWFVEWLEEHKPEDPVYLYFHCALDDVGWDIDQLCDYTKSSESVLVPDKNAITVWKGIKEEYMHLIYNSLNTQVSTTHGEGWGLTNFEGAACGIPQIVPDWAALSEWPEDAFYKVSCLDESGYPNYIVSPGNINTVGAGPNRTAWKQALTDMYENEELREGYSKKGLELVHRPEFSWMRIGEQFSAILQNTMKQKHENKLEEVENNV